MCFYIFNKSDQINWSILLVIFFLLGGCETPTNNDSGGTNDSGDTVGCTNEYACNYGSMDVCDYGTWCSDGSQICEGSICSDQNSETLNINYISSSIIAGFQFGISGVTIQSIDSNSGAAQDAGFSVAKGGINNGVTTIMGFSMTGATMAAGSGILLVLEVEGSIDAACLSDLVFSDPVAGRLNATVENCTTINIQ